MLEEILKVLVDNGLEVIVAVISILVSYYVIPTIKNTLVPFLEEKRLLATIKSLVEGVEKLAESGQLAKIDKKAKVLELLEAKGIKVTPEVEILIEACVKELDLVTNTVIKEIKETEENNQ